MKFFNWRKMVFLSVTSLVLTANVWAANILTEVMARRAEKDVLAAVKTYVPTGKLDEYISQAPAPSAGLAIYQSKGCAACHGIDGDTPIMPIYPKIAGQNKDYLLAQMRAIKSSVRNNGQSNVMTAVVSGVSDTDLSTIADWLASLPASASSTTGAANGFNWYQSQVCFSCHGMDAKTPITPAYPKLAGQNADYVLAQMKDIGSGKRNNGQSAAMKTIVSAVPDADLKAIAQWLATLK